MMALRVWSGYGRFLGCVPGYECMRVEDWSEETAVYLSSKFLKGQGGHP